MSVVLASSSPRRSQLFQRLGVPFEIVPSAVEERDPVPGEDPALYALELAHHKAREVAALHPNDLVLGADTVVVLDREILNKPLAEDEALKMLTLLKGRTHSVITAVVVRRGSEQRSGTVRAEVTMRDYGVEEIKAYVASGEPMDKAGAYAVQGVGGALVERVAGCYDTVVGLPLCLVSKLLRDFGVEVVESGHCGAGTLPS